MRENEIREVDPPNSVLDFDNEIRFMKNSDSAFPFHRLIESFSMSLSLSLSDSQSNDEFIIQWPTRIQSNETVSVLLRIESVVQWGWKTTTSRSTVVESVEFIAMNIYDIIKFNQCNYDFWICRLWFGFPRSNHEQLPLTTTSSTKIIFA